MDMGQKLIFTFYNTFIIIILTFPKHKLRNVLILLHISSVDKFAWWLSSSSDESDRICDVYKNYNIM